MVQVIVERRNYGRKPPVSIKCHILYSFEEGLILLCQSILETMSEYPYIYMAQLSLPSL